MNKLKEIRNRRGLSQLRLAFMTGIAPSDISRIENYWLYPYPGWRKRLARALGTTESDLFPPDEDIQRQLRRPAQRKGGQNAE